MPRHIPFYSELLEKDHATTSEILLYGLIEASSFTEGFCYASSDYMATQIGVSPKTIRNLLSSLSNRGWISVEVEGNKRVAITPLLGLSIKEKKSVPQKGRSVENSKESVPSAGQYCPVKRTLASRQRDTLDRGVTDKGIINNNNIIIKEINKEKETAGSAGSGPAGSFLPKRADFENDEEFEKAFYNRNTVCLGAH